MDSPEQIPNQDQKLSSLVDQAVENLRQGLLARLEEIRSQVERQARAEAAAAAAAAPPPRREGAASLESLHGAISSVDRSRSQNEILTALLKGGVRFASRSVLLLVGQDGLGGWGASGFGAAAERIGSVRLPYGEHTAWAKLAAGRGGVELNSADCALLCDQIDGSRPAGGVLIPLILRDRIAACLYADRLAREDVLDHLALQLLTYASGQAIETLALRERRSTATLRLAAEAPAEEAGLPLWQAEASTPAVEVEVEAPGEPAPEAPSTLPAEEVETAAEPATPPYPEAAEPADVYQPPTPEAPGEPPLDEAYPESVESVQDSGFAVEPAEGIQPPRVEEMAGQTQQIPTEPRAQPAPPSFDMPATEATPDTLPETAASQAEGLFTEPEAAPPPPPEPPPSPAQPAPSGAQVAPPDDLQGPGWAFTTTIASPTDSGDQSEHEEARRLARLLVTEIKLYNEEQVEEGRRKGNIYRELKEDIDRSRQIFEERIDEQIRSEADYFHEELVRILAGGDAEALGV